MILIIIYIVSWIACGIVGKATLNWCFGVKSPSDADDALKEGAWTMLGPLILVLALSAILLVAVLLLLEQIGKLTFKLSTRRCNEQTNHSGSE